MTRVMADVTRDAAEQPHAVALNLNQTYLGYWKRPLRRAGHFNFAYGYDFHDGGTITIGDGGNSSVFGSHVVALEEVFTAVKANKSIVVW
jgi:hypothetical protein